MVRPSTEELAKTYGNIKLVIRIAVIAVFGLILLAVILGSWYTIGQRERGVILRNGAVVGTAEPGLHFKIPWFESIVTINIQQQTMRWACVKSTDGSFDANCARDDLPEMQSYSQDQQPASLRISVNYHVPDSQVTTVYSTFGSVENLADRIIGRKAPQQVKTVFGQFTAVTVIQERARFNKEVSDSIIGAIGGTDAPVVIDSVQIENIEFSKGLLERSESALSA